MSIEDGEFTESQKLQVKQLILDVMAEMKDDPRPDLGETCLYKDGRAQLFGRLNVPMALEDGWSDTPTNPVFFKLQIISLHQLDFQ